ncbi:MAG: hypothetical protein K8F25_08970 [Fimbriimonadaceae bacterium]|nr:hypothetical protein [Alphaproteobacteria bacterium]
MMSIHKIEARFIFLITLLLFSVSSAVANARPWEILSDGRIVIEIFDERLAFHPQDASLVSFQRSYGGKYHTFTLKDAISNPNAARAFFDGPRLRHLGVWVNINISQESASNPNRPFLGKYNWEQLPRTIPTEPFRFSILPNNEPLAFRKDPIAGVMRFIRPHERPPSPPHVYFTKALGPSEFGFTSFPFEDPLPEQKHNGVRTIHILPGSERLRSSEVDLQIMCEKGGSPWRYCHFIQLSKDELVTVFLRWGENKLPENSWKQLDNLVHRIAATVFIDRIEKDFE